MQETIVQNSNIENGENPTGVINGFTVSSFYFLSLANCTLNKADEALELLNGACRMLKQISSLKGLLLSTAINALDSGNIAQ
jgi:hypothetical protein